MYHFHPIIVHFTIGLLSVAILTDLLYLLTGKDNFRQLSAYLLGIGIVCSIGAVLTGNQAREAIEIAPELEGLVDSHRLSATIAMWSFIALGVCRFIFAKLHWLDKPQKWFYYLLGIVAVIFLFRTGILGGEMVYIHGVGIHKETQKPLQKPSFE